MLQIATDGNCSISLDKIRDRLSVSEIMDIIDVIDLRNSWEQEAYNRAKSEVRK